jgi:hypothetical protein
MEQLLNYSGKLIDLVRGSKLLQWLKKNEKVFELYA